MAGTTFTGPITIQNTPDGSSFATLAAVTDNSGGTASDTIAAIGATYTQAEVANAIATLAARVNALAERIS